jgi:FixJ family two-component response regulator
MTYLLASKPSKSINLILFFLDIEMPGHSGLELLDFLMRKK